MAVYKEPKTNTWRVIYRYTDWNGERKQSQKRGFQTKREAQSWEREQLNKLGSDLDMTFRSFVEHYEEDRRSRIKDSTWESKEHIIRTKLLPYFGKLKMSSITPQQIVRWQNELINYRDKDGAPYSPVYLKSIQNQISAIFNQAVRYYNLKENPCKKAGSMGKKKNREMAFWTKEEYLQFIDAMIDKPLSFYAFEMLYWCGIREGELLALTPADFDFDKCTVTINKTFQHTGGRLNSYLTDIDRQAEEMFSRLVKQMAEVEGVTEQLKADSQMAWVGRMNNIRNRAMEMVNNDLIYAREPAARISASETLEPPKVFWKYYDLFRRKRISLSEYAAATGLSAFAIRHFLKNVVEKSPKAIEKPKQI